MSNDRTYYGGSTVRGQIRQLGATGFKQLVESYFNVPFAFPMTRAAFLAHPDRDTLKDIDYVCPCTFKDPAGRRRIENAKDLVLVILDLDEGDFVKRLAEAPETIGDALWPLNFVCFTTAKHTPEAPRLKIAVDVAHLPVGLHRRAVHYIAHTRLGLPEDFKGNRESKVVVQPAYRPMQFEGEAFTAVLASRTNGSALTEEDIPELPPEEPGKRVYAYQGEIDNSPESLAFLPIMDLRVEDVTEALYAIDPDCNRRVWVDILMALRHQWRDEHEAFEAFDAVDTWSSQGTKYPGEKAVWYQWNSLRPDAIGRNPVTIRTLFHHAMEAGWDNTRLAATISQNINEWLSECTDGDELLTSGTRRIAALPFRNDAVDEALCDALAKRIKLVTRSAVAKATLLKEVRRLRHAKRIEEDDGNLPAWLRPWCYIGAERNVFYNVLSGITMSPESFNRFYGKELMPQDANDEQAASGRPAIQPADFALNVKKIRRVDGATYDPRHGGAEPYFEIEGSWFVNEYRQSTVPALGRDEETRRAGKIIEAHMALLIEEKQYQNHTLDFIAFMVQNPGELIKHCIVIQSAQGAGKSLIGKLLSAALGRPNVKLVSPSVMQSDFNDWLAGAQAVVFEELRVKGKNRDEVMNKVKMAISDEDIPLNRKFQPVVMVPNVTNQIAFTNYPDALLMDADDRRYMPVRSPIQSREQVQALRAAGKFDAMWILVKKFPEAVRRYFMERKVSPDFDPNGPAPDTIYRAQMVEECKNPLQAAIEELIEGEDPRFGDDVIDLKAMEDELGHLTVRNSPVTSYLARMNYADCSPGSRHSVNGHRTAVWVHRSRWEAEFGDPVDLLRWRTEKWKAANNL